jgi:glutathione S-transferase
VTERPVLVVGNVNYSSWSMRPWLLMKATGVDFEQQRIPLDTPQFAGEIARWSRSSRVPALRHGEVEVWDSLSICEYVNETFLGGRGWPADARARAWARSICAEMHSGFSELRGECPMNVRRVLDQPLALGAGAQRDAQRVQGIWRETRERFGAGGEFLFGGFGIADAYYGPIAFRFRTYGVALDAVAKRYVEAMLAHPAVREWMDAAANEPETIAKYERIGA